jgi:CHAD domain-containing protein
LRINVALENGLREQAAEPAAERAFKCWEKEGKKLRRALRKVRDADVYLARLDGLREAHGGTTEGETELSPRCLAEMDKLASRLKQRRQAGIDKLMALLEARGKRLNQLSQEMEAAFAPRMPASANSLAQAALKIFIGLANDLPHLDSANLHTYRKRLKPALYLAESAAATDPEAKSMARQLATAFRRIHLAIGEWHDWQTLAVEAGRILPGHGKAADGGLGDGGQDGLLPLLEGLTERAFKRSLGLCHRTSTRFLAA